MATDLADLIEPLKREIAVPGEFDAQYPDTADTDLNGSLQDAFAECQLDGYFPDMTLDLNTSLVDPDLSMAGGALITIYAAIRIIRSKIRQLATTERYVAATVEYEIGRSAAVLKEELASLDKRRMDLLANARRSGRITYVYDSYYARAFTNWSSVGGFYSYELG